MSDDDQASNASSAAGSDDEGSSSDSDQLSVMTPVDSDEDSDAESQVAGAGGGAGGGAGAGAGAGASVGIESAPPQSGLSMQRASSYDVYTPHDVDASMDKVSGGTSREIVVAPVCSPAAGFFFANHATSGHQGCPGHDLLVTGRSQHSAAPSHVGNGVCQRCVWSS